MTRLMFAFALAVVLAPMASPTASANGCHRNAQYGPAGLHYHVGPDCDRVAGSRGYRRSDGYDDRRGNRCYQKCQYIGPIKTCDRVCR
jgi:hypothetical protein